MQLFLKKSGKKVSIYQQMGYEYRLFSLLNFPGAVIFNFYDVICDCCTQNNVFIFNRIASKKFKIHIQFFHALKFSFHFLEK